MKSFEEKIAKLEENVKALETGDVPLEKAIEKYTETMQLARECEEMLQLAREQIAKVVNEDGSIKVIDE